MATATSNQRKIEKEKIQIKQAMYVFKQLLNLTTNSQSPLANNESNAGCLKIYNAGSLKIKFQKNMSQTRIFNRHKKEIKLWHNFLFLIKRGKTKDAQTCHLQQQIHSLALVSWLSEGAFKSLIATIIHNGKFSNVSAQSRLLIFYFFSQFI